MSLNEPKKISVSQEKRYVAEGWKVVERSDCGKYVYVTKE